MIMQKKAVNISVEHFVYCMLYKQRTPLLDMYYNIRISRIWYIALNRWILFYYCKHQQNSNTVNFFFFNKRSQVAAALNWKMLISLLIYVWHQILHDSSKKRNYHNIQQPTTKFMESRDFSQLFWCSQQSKATCLELMRKRLALF